MIVYVYKKRSQEKLYTIKNAVKIQSLHDRFEIFTTDTKPVTIPKKQIQLVVYGF